MIWKNLCIATLSAFFITTFCVFLFRTAAYKVGLVDTPSQRKKHTGNIPLVGGAAMFLGFCFAYLMLYVPLESYRAFFAAAGLLMLVGVIDDWCNLDAKIRLATQFLAAMLAVIWGGASLHNFGNLFLFGNIHIGSWGIIVSILAFVTMVNAMNMLDGADGFAGIIAFIQLAFLAIIAFMNHSLIDAQFIVLLLACLLGFLLFNFPLPRSKKNPFHVFMGDAGSTFLGFTIAWYCVKLSQQHSASVAPINFLWIIALPLFDVVTSAVRRIKKGQSPFQADREHFHHILKAARFSPFQCAITAALITLTTSAIGLILNWFNTPDFFSLILFLCALAIYMTLIMKAWTIKKLLRFYKSKLRALADK